MSQKGFGIGNAFQTFLLIILVLLSSFHLAFIMWLTPSFQKTSGVSDKNASSGLEKVVREAILAQEYERVGGKDAYDTITKLSILNLNHPQNPNNLAAMKAALKELEKDGPTITAESPDAVDLDLNATGTQNSNTKTTKTLSTEEREKILENAVVEWNKNADIMVIEYSDMECPYCLRQHNDNEIHASLVKEFGDKIAFAFKNHRGVNHRGTEAKALGALCANKLGGTEKYVQFYTAIFDFSKQNEGYYPVTKLADIAKEIGLDVSAWQSCVDSKEFLPVFEAQTSEAIKYGMNGTPGTLLFNTKTGKFDTVAGAYPYSQFQSVVKSLLVE